MGPREPISCGNVAFIFHAYQHCQAGNLLITKLVKYLLTTVTEKFNFVFFSEPCLIFYILSQNHSLVNVYKLLCCIFIIFFHSDISSVVIDNFNMYYFLNYNICKMIILQMLRDLSQFYPSVAMKTCYFCTVTFSFGKEHIK